MVKTRDQVCQIAASKLGVTPVSQTKFMSEMIAFELRGKSED